MNILKETLKKAIYREKYSSETFIKFLKKKNISIGEHCTIYNPRNTIIDYQNPQAITIGNFVRIADGVKILTHDYSLSVVAGVTGNIIGSVKPVVIGSNVFIGMNAIILNNIRIGNNVIIGAGSVVTHDCEDNSVYAGNPAKRICSIDQLHKKRKKYEKEDAKALVKIFYKKTGKVPDEQILREYLMLFSNRKKEIPDELKKLMQDSGNYQKCVNNFYQNRAEFKDIDDFIHWCDLKELSK